MSFLGFFNGGGAGVANLGPQEFAEGFRNDPDAVLLDVRTDMEYGMGHIPGAELMDIMDPRLMDMIGQLDKSRKYYVYCRSGNRSMQVCRIMQRNGFEHTYNLGRGILDWHEELVTEDPAR